MSHDNFNIIHGKENSEVECTVSTVIKMWTLMTLFFYKICDHVKRLKLFIYIYTVWFVFLRIGIECIIFLYLYRVMLWRYSRRNIINY